MERIQFSDFYRETQMKHLPIHEEDWLLAIEEALDFGEVLPGYRDGVVLVRTPQKFPHRTVEILPKDRLEASFTPRVEGEDPRKKIQVFRQKLPLAHSTFVVLYRWDVLNLSNERSKFSEWEVITHLTSSVDTPEPMHPDTLIANHFQFSGGTPTGMSPEKFEEELKASVEFWKNRAIATVRTSWWKKLMEGLSVLVVGKTFLD